MRTAENGSTGLVEIDSFQADMCELTFREILTKLENISYFYDIMDKIRYILFIGATERFSKQQFDHVKLNRKDELKTPLAAIRGFSQYLYEELDIRTYHKLGQKIFKVKNLKSKNLLNDISFSLNKGEILGISGLVGAGRTELARAIFGID